VVDTSSRPNRLAGRRSEEMAFHSILDNYIF
jgi:hypothetical protein